MEKIYTNKREIILVDKKHLNELKKFTWYVDANGYAVASPCVMSREQSRKTGLPRQMSIKMHRLIYELENNIKLKSSEHIDHKNRNKLKNTICNLRISALGTSINQINVGLRSDNKSGYKGVCFREKTGKYESKISFKGKRIWIGAYKDVKKAAKAYNEKAIELFGDACYLNK